MKLNSTSLMLTTALLASAALISACTTPSSSSTSSTASKTSLNDGDLPIPADYKTWPKFLSTVQRPDAKQVREIFMNPTAKNGGSYDKGFPNGSVFVMENYAAAENADGSLKKDANGKLVKGALVAVFVQGKNPGWGSNANPVLKNGDWIYSAYTPTGAKHPQDTNSCRACHLPLANKDFVHRYDEYFSTQRSSLDRFGLVTALKNPNALSSQEVAHLVRYSSNIH